MSSMFEIKTVDFDEISDEFVVLRVRSARTKPTPSITL